MILIPNHLMLEQARLGLKAIKPLISDNDNDNDKDKGISSLGSKSESSKNYTNPHIALMLLHIRLLVLYYPAISNNIYTDL